MCKCNECVRKDEKCGLKSLTKHGIFCTIMSQYNKFGICDRIVTGNAGKT